MSSGIKRLMGRDVDDKEIDQDIRGWSFKVVKDNDRFKIETHFKDERKRYLPEQISALILEKMKSTAEDFLGDKIKDVVITCPAYFNNSQRQATKDAAQIAGLNVLRMINEPTAAAMAYGLSANNVGRKNVLIFDFGGGTFDVSILTIKDKEYKVLATNGDTYLGGEDFDQRMVKHFVVEFKLKHNRDISDNKELMFILKTLCEKAKRILSFALKNEFALEGTNLTGSITRACFEEMNYDLFEKAIQLVGAVLEDAEMSKEEIDDVVLVGGSSRIPKVRELLRNFFNGKTLSQGINPDEAVAMGAAIQAGMLQNEVSHELKGLKLCDVCPLSLGIHRTDGSVCNIIKRNTPIPAKASKTFCNNDDYQTEVLIQVYEGERFMAKDNHFLGEFTVDGLPPMLRYELNIEETIEIDENGIVKVSALIPLTGVTKSITITNKSRLSKDDADRLAIEAAKFREEDAINEARLVAYNDFELYLYNVKRKIGETGHKQMKLFKALVDGFSFWLEQNMLASKEQFEQKKRELEDLMKNFE